MNGCVCLIDIFPLLFASEENRGPRLIFRAIQSLIRAMCLEAADHSVLLKTRPQEECWPSQHTRSSLAKPEGLTDGLVIYWSCSALRFSIGHRCLRRRMHEPHSPFARSLCIHIYIQYIYMRMLYLRYSKRRTQDVLYMWQKQVKHETEKQKEPFPEKKKKKILLWRRRSGKLCTPSSSLYCVPFCRFSWAYFFI